MALMYVCSVFDEKAESFMPPSFVPAPGIASRDFTDALTASDAKMAKYRSDFKLYHVAHFDTNTGEFTTVTPPRLMLNGSDIGGE